ncbi:hypothetical protein OCH239_10800 [Roseivivax halodurans JCM 10272]|uniref:HepT-like domain-containing protein n=1 Tax=Roseivivax halodurans JCM 10272 TaxID=1449350 RepID=X7EDX2_9RHOB|nr:hypothetical protein [Roseivivax halodurans]ETX13323.1 hypothetical protein OCH239_10800 [Roseivivax halodurans JCM 10272]
MTDARWLEVWDDAERAARHFRNAATLFDEGGFDRPGMDGYRSEMALMHAMQSGHTLLESCLLRILKIFDEEKPAGDSWHADLLARARKTVGARAAILDPEAFKHADETRRFRTVATRSYDDFQLAGAERAIGSARWLAEVFEDLIRDYQARVDPPSDDLDR